MDRETGRSKGFGFVSFAEEDRDAVQNSIDRMNDKVRRACPAGNTRGGRQLPGEGMRAAGAKYACT